jgi:hypothetical protein
MIMEGWAKQCHSHLGDRDYILTIYVLEKQESKWFVCSELVDDWREIKVGKKTGRKHISWAGYALYLDELQEVGEPRNSERKFTYAVRGKV